MAAAVFYLTVLAALRRTKVAHPDALVRTNGEPRSRVLAALRTLQGKGLAASDERGTWRLLDPANPEPAPAAAWDEPDAQPETPEEAELVEQLKHHDWFYEYSDDHRVFRRGSAQRDAINLAVAKVAPGRRNALWNAHAPELHRRKG